MIRHPSGSRRGLTLLEVMLAIFLIGIAFTAILSLSAKALLVVQTAKDFETARNLLEKLKLQEPLQIDEIDGDDSDGGKFDGDEFRRFRWERDIEEVGEESDELYRVSTRIVWSQEPNKKLKEEIVTLLHLPTARSNGWIDEKAAED